MNMLKRLAASLVLAVAVAACSSEQTISVSPNTALQVGLKVGFRLDDSDPVS